MNMLFVRLRRNVDKCSQFPCIISDIASNQGGSKDDKDVVLTAPLDYSAEQRSMLQ